VKTALAISAAVVLIVVGLYDIQHHPRRVERKIGTTVVSSYLATNNIEIWHTWTNQFVGGKMETVSVERTNQLWFKFSFW
jgi:hypothetical protein